MISLSIKSFLAVVFLTFAALFALALALPVNPYIRFQNLDDTIYFRAKWIYERIHFDPTPIDVVILGSSRAGAGAYPTLIEPALQARGTPAHVVNFSLPSSGFDLRETIVQELFKEKAPKLLIFDVAEAFPRDGHDAFGELAPVSEILNSPFLVNRNLPKNILRLPIREISLSMMTLMPEAYGKQAAFSPTSYSGTVVNPRDMLNFEDNLEILDTAEHAEKLAAQAKIRRRSLTPPLLPDSLSWIEFGVSQSYINRIVSLAEEHGTKVVFLFMPFYTGPGEPLESKWLQQRHPLWNADFMKNDPRNYEDSAHSAASPRVKEMLTNWFSEKISAELSGKGTP